MNNRVRNHTPTDATYLTKPQNEDLILSRFDELMTRMTEENAAISDEELEEDIKRERDRKLLSIAGKFHSDASDLAEKHGLSE